MEYQMKGGTSLVRDSLDEVFRLLANPTDQSQKILVQMAKVLNSVSQSDTQSLIVPDPCENAIASLAIAFSLLMKNLHSLKMSMGHSLNVEGSDRVKQEPSLEGEEEIDEEKDHFFCTTQIKQESPEEEEIFSPLSPPQYDPFLSSVNWPSDEGSQTRPVLKSASSIKRETERMEIMKRRMIESQLEMDGWPVKRKEFKVDDNTNKVGSGKATNNNNVSSPSPSSLPSSSTSILFHCPLSAAGVCREESTTKEESYYHVQLCHPDFALPFPCKECTLSFRYKHELREHNECRHSPPVPIRHSLYLHKLYFSKQVKCPHCSFSSSSARLFLSHHSSEHAVCGHPHVSCSDALCRRRFKFSTLTQVIYHYGAVGACRGQCSLIKA